MTPKTSGSAGHTEHDALITGCASAGRAVSTGAGRGVATDVGVGLGRAVRTGAAVGAGRSVRAGRGVARTTGAAVGVGLTSAGASGPHAVATTHAARIPFTHLIRM
jgi:hypothetical protein